MPNKCHLPRVGSKEWEWARQGNIYCSDQMGYYIRMSASGPNIFNESGIFASRGPNFATAKRIAELLARLDWKRKMRGKK